MINYINKENRDLYMERKQTLSLKDLIPITEIKEDLNLLFFKSPNFSTEHMKFNNQLMEAIANIKIEVNVCDS